MPRRLVEIFALVCSLAVMNCGDGERGVPFTEAQPPEPGLEGGAPSAIGAAGSGVERAPEGNPAGRGGGAGDETEPEPGAGAGSDAGGAQAGGATGDDAHAGGSANPDYAGVWSGLTDQDQPIEFVIDGIGMVQLEYGWILPLCSSTTTLSLAAPARVIDDHVEYMLMAPAGMSTAVGIDFESAALATGSLMFTLRPPPGPPPPVPACSGTSTVVFTAMKTPPI